MNICLKLKNACFRDNMRAKLLGLWLSLLVSGCAVMPSAPQVGYAAISKQHLNALYSWSLNGRVSITSPEDSWSANIAWQRTGGDHSLLLSGPFGQNAVNIQLTESGVTVDRGDGKPERSSDADAFVSAQLGVFVPVRSLTYWVIGLPEPTEKVVYSEQGFSQKEWQIEYKEWQVVGHKSMPRKMIVTNGKLKLKLVYDQWKIK